MKQQPLVSFILTDYNLPTELLCEAIDSILRLSLRSTEREIIIVDDGSDSSPMNSLLAEEQRRECGAKHGDGHGTGGIHPDHRR